MLWGQLNMNLNETPRVHPKQKKKKCKTFDGQKLK